MRNGELQAFSIFICETLGEYNKASVNEYFDATF